MFLRNGFPVRSIVLLLLVALAATGCGSSKQASAPTSTPVPQTVDASLSVDAAQVELRSGADGDWAAVTGTQIVHSADAVRTDATGQATLTFFTGTQAEIAPGSELEVSSYEPTEGGGAVITLKQLSGQTLHRVELVADSGSRYELDTPVAHVTVRGTEFGITVAEDGGTQVTVTKGTVHVEAGGQQIDVTPGQALDVSADAVPGTPYPIDQGIQTTPVPTPSIGAILPPAATPTQSEGK
jgi:hypothetical protein